MKTGRCGRARWWGPALAALGVLAVAPGLRAQTTTMPSTLRYGSGLMDIPVASVLPSMEMTATYSGFFVNLGRTAQIDADGNTTGYGPGVKKRYADASVALGLFDRAEVGTTIQSLNSGARGGNMWGVFGRLQLVRPRSQGVGLAVGARYVTAPTYGNGTQYEPGRLGFPDMRLYNRYPGKNEVNTQVSLYGVATAQVHGSDGGLLPRHDVTLAIGYGTGMFKDGHDLPFYAYTSSDGWFFGSAVALQAGGSSILTLMGEYNGFDVNLGVQYDIRGIRLGAQYLAANYRKPAGGYDSEYRMPKLGLLGSVAVCPDGGSFLCKPHLMKRRGVPSDTLQLPPPPPDTVLVIHQVERPLPTGTPASICLATGQNLEVWVTAQGDTLVGPGRSPIETLRPGLRFAGAYAGTASWYESGEGIAFRNRSYRKTGGVVRLDCTRIERVGENEGVPLFVPRGAVAPFETLYVPVRPGIWQVYQAVPRRAR
jgi:hypothetical protein